MSSLLAWSVIFFIVKPQILGHFAVLPVCTTRSPHRNNVDNHFFSLAGSVALVADVADLVGVARYRSQASNRDSFV